MGSLLSVTKDLGVPDVLSLMVFLAITGFAAVLIVMSTSYVKVAIVLSLVRNAIGVQGVPPNLVMNSIALVLTAFIMAPVFQDSFDIIKQNAAPMKDFNTFQTVADRAAEPLRKFLEKHAADKDKTLFVEAAQRLWADRGPDVPDASSLLILVPSFMLSELTRAFQIGFLLYLPFLVIDLLVSNVLLAFGMMMMSPVTISLPFKLFLFVAADGWERLVKALILSYS